MGSICTNSLQNNFADYSPRSGGNVAPINMSSLKGITNYISKNCEAFEDVYETEQRKLGFGFYGDVKMCVHRVTGVARAVKIMSKERFGRGTLSEDWFFKQIEIISQIDHPCFIRVHEYFEDRDYFYLVMDYHEEGSLSAKLKSSKTCSEDFIKKLMKKLLSGITYLHSLGIVHRDLKPENILVNEKDGEILVKIIDFDTCTKLNESGKISGLFGTAFYMPPEMVPGQYDSKCDLWSLGMVMYNLMTQKFPFSGMSDREIINNIQKVQINFHCPELLRFSKDCRSMLEKLLQKDPIKRISAENALLDPWLSIPETYSKIEITLNSLHKSKVKNIAIKEFLIKHFSTLKDFEELDLAFIELDTDNDGVISISDVLQFYYKGYNKAEAHQKTEDFFDRLKGLSEEFVSYEDFLNACVNLKDVLDEKRISRFLEKGTGGLTGFCVDGMTGVESWDWFLDLKRKIDDDLTPKDFRGIVLERICVKL